MARVALFEDTSPAAEQVLLDGYRRMTPARKIARIRDLNWTLQHLALADLRRRFPDDDEQTLRLRLASRRFDRETMVAAFGWDPQTSG